MAGIIKNQILKHLSRFVKNLSADRINVSTLKGEGELTNLDLEEEVLTELLALPIWMRIKFARCNRAKILIQWTKLKSTPIRLMLDTVEIQVEACETLRPVVTGNGANNYNPGKYGFVNKVVDGITVTVESVEIKFVSKAFESKVQISRIRVESRSPQWKRVELTQTRLKDVDRGEVLTFKEIDWQNLRLEAQSTLERHLAPLRLLTNQAKARVVIKKKLSDCSVVGCRLSLILDDLLWVLTDSQILAAVHFMSSLSGLIKQATETSQHVKAARKLESQPEFLAQQTQSANSDRVRQSDASIIFDRFDVKETSYHLVCDKINLHFCDDPGGGRSNHPDLSEGGAAQIQLTQLMIDFYPYHLAKADRKFWPKYSANDLTRWLKDSLSAFQANLTEVLFPKSTSSAFGHGNPGGNRKSLDTPSVEGVVYNRINEQYSKLMSTCLVLKIRDICLYKVTTSSRETLLPFLSSYLERPKEVSLLHMELTWFYYPGGACFPLPSPKTYIQVHPFQIHLDICTVLWLNSFVTNLQTCMPQPEASNDSDYMDIRVEVIMPKVVMEGKSSHFMSRDRPQSLEAQAARIVMANYRSAETGTAAQLSLCINAINSLKNELNSESTIPQRFMSHARGQHKAREDVKTSSYSEMAPHLTTDMLWTEPRDMWFISIDAIWADFCTSQKIKCENTVEGGRKFGPTNTSTQPEVVMQPFIDSIPLQLWLYVEEEPVTCNMDLPKKKKKNIEAILYTDRLSNVQLSHPQYIYLMRIAEAISEMSLFLTIDTRKTFNFSMQDDSVNLIGCLPSIEVSFIMPTLPLSYELPRDNSSYLDLNEFPQGLETKRVFEFENMEKNEKPEIKDWNFSQSPPSTSFGEMRMDSPEHQDVEPQMANYSSNTSIHNLPSMDSFKTLTQGMKQGLNSLVVSFNKGGQSTPDSEVTSMWSTGSSENNYVLLESPESEALPVDENVEVAEEVVEDNSQSTGSFSLHNPYAREDNTELNILSIYLHGISLGQSSTGLDSEISFSCGELELKETMSIPWNEFQADFQTKSKKWKRENELSKEKFWNYQSKAIKLLFSQKIDENKFKEFLSSGEMKPAGSFGRSKGPRLNLLESPGVESPMRKAIVESTYPSVIVEVNLRQDKSENKFITLHSSILKGISDFFEDEVPPTILPLQVQIFGVNIEIIEEKNPPIPSTRVTLSDGIFLTRDPSGLFSLKCFSATNGGTDHLHSKPVSLASLNEKCDCKSKNKLSRNPSQEIQDLKRTILELQQKVSDLQQNNSFLVNKLQSDKNQHLQNSLNI